MPIDDLADLLTPAPLVDLDRMETNLERMAAYAREHGLALRPHTKTHKSPSLAATQLARGATGVTVATAREAVVMASVAHDLLLAYPPAERGRLGAVTEIARSARVTVALDGRRALELLAGEAARAGVRVGVLLELEVGMRRCGLGEPDAAVRLARLAAELSGVEYRGIMFYPGHIREPVEQQSEPLERLNETLASFLDALTGAGLEPPVISGGSTPTAFASHRVHGITEIRPGTYVFNDRTTAVIGACGWDDCAYSVLATVVSTAVPGQAVVDAGSKALAREELRAPSALGFGALLDRPEVVVSALSEEHGVLDLSRSDWRPEVGERVRIVPNHVCVSVNLHERIWGLRGDRVEAVWTVAARGHRAAAPGAEQPAHGQSARSSS